MTLFRKHTIKFILAAILVGIFAVQPIAAALQYSTTARNAILDSLTTQVGTNAYLRIYTGAAPADCATAASGTLLAELRGNASAWAGAASGGVLTLNAITQDSSADATGTAGYFRWFQSNGTTCVVQGTVGTSGADLNLVTTSITATQPVQVTAWTITAPGA